MSRSPSGSSVDDETFLLEYRCHPVRPQPPSPTSLGGTHGPAPLPAALGSAAAAEPHRVVLSTDSPAALKVGTQQLIPKSLAVSTKTKNSPSRTQSFGAGGSSREPRGPDPKRASVPGVAAEGEDDDVGSLKRNLRNMSYRAAMKGPAAEPEPLAAVPSLKPVSEEGSALPARSPGRSKRAFGRKRVQKRGGSFKDQPRLYQEIRERGLNSVSHESDEDLLEESVPAEPSPPDTTIVVQTYRPAQVTWSQLPEVLEAGILPRISPEERRRQEAMFEIITSEYSYMHSLGVLVCHFMRSEELKETMTQTEHHHLFSNISDILTVSTSFFEALEKRHQENVLIPDISDIVEEHASSHFSPYISYCSNEVYQQRTLQKLLNINPLFKETLKQIERKPECGGLPLISFLILPMQRVTRLPLLLDTVCQKTKAGTAAYGAATRALKAISKLVKNCNEGARAMERTEQMYTLQKQLKFGKKKPFPLISASRWLLKRGELQLLLAEDGGIFCRGAGRLCHLLLFNDVLILTKKKSEESYTVINYATLDHVTVEKVESVDPPSPAAGRAGGHLLRVAMEKDSEGRREEVVLAAETLSERARWITALMHREKETPDTTPKGELRQVEITCAYLAKQADELSLQQADVVLVLGEEDGWCWGERLRDGERGWFPQRCARHITSRAAVECNVRRMERLRIETDV
ncbi:rho guanine nucleotide exchange factor 16 [Colius striatus]|uniref:rho guanine nucleotide exchange factor 16 n=1 Tax=Colius striatus TaxID=57412 RepID=UPI002B1E71D1|nr:rho guanine nucleotide exchange factor 16 [Colius striatus]XP_061868847.1 rho guanine nucleotide exchange factor 16 [Colius striatus]XP_061868849.1 rho guanine nucleotide exchange factor 16 [Colius striatus]